MAARPGVDFLDKNLMKHLERPNDVFYDDEDASAIGLMFELFAKTGTSTWVSSSEGEYIISLTALVTASEEC